MIVGKDRRDALRVLTPQRLAGEKSHHVDVVRMELRSIVGVVDGAELGIVDALLALVRCQRARRRSVRRETT